MYISKKKRQFLYDCKNISTIHLKNIYSIFLLAYGTAVWVDPYKNNCYQRLFVNIPAQQPIDSHGNSDVQAPPFHNWMTFSYLLMSSLQTVPSHLSLVSVRTLLYSVVLSVKMFISEVCTRADLLLMRADLTPPAAGMDG